MAVDGVCEQSLKLVAKKKKGNTGCFFQAVWAMLVDSMQSVGHGLFKEFGWIDGRGGQKGTLVIAFGHTHGPRTGVLEPPLYYSLGLDTVTVGVAGPSFVLNKWHFLLLTLVVDPRFLRGDLETSSLAEISIPWEMLIKFTCESYLCRQSEVDFGYIISIPMCPERRINELCVWSHTEPEFSRAEAN